MVPTDLGRCPTLADFEKRNAPTPTTGYPTPQQQRGAHDSGFSSPNDAPSRDEPQVAMKLGEPAGEIAMIGDSLSSDTVAEGTPTAPGTPVPAEAPAVPAEVPAVPAEAPAVPAEAPAVPAEAPAVTQVTCVETQKQANETLMGVLADLKKTMEAPSGDLTAVDLLAATKI
eukprot:3602626-Pyramimonas_sp.AAC.1